MIDGEIYCIERIGIHDVIFIYRETGCIDHITHYACMLSDDDIKVLGYGATGILGNYFDNVREATDREKLKFEERLWEEGFLWNKANKKMTIKD